MRSALASSRAQLTRMQTCGTRCICCGCTWSPVDANGLTDFYGLQALALRAMVESGKSFGRLRIADTGAGLPPLQIELLDREQVPTDLHRETGGGARIRAGIEFDAAGKRIAYHCYRHRPGDALAPMALDTVRVPAADIVHLFQALAPGQLRGITSLAPILLRLHELDQYEDAALVKAKVAALFTGFIRDPDGTVAGLNNGSAINGVLQVGMEPGSLIPLPPGADIQFSRPGRSRRLWRIRQEPHPRHRVRTWAPLRAGLGRPRRRYLLLDPRRAGRVSPPHRAAPAHCAGVPVLPPGVGAFRAACGAFRCAAGPRFRS